MKNRFRIFDYELLKLLHKCDTAKQVYNYLKAHNLNSNRYSVEDMEAPKDQTKDTTADIFIIEYELNLKK